MLSWIPQGVVPALREAIKFWFWDRHHCEHLSTGEGRFRMVRDPSLLMNAPSIITESTTPTARRRRANGVVIADECAVRQLLLSRPVYPFESCTRDQNAPLHDMDNSIFSVAAPTNIPRRTPSLTPHRACIGELCCAKARD